MSDWRKIRGMGSNETAEDLRPFSARDFANSLMGIEG